MIHAIGVLLAVLAAVWIVDFLFWLMGELMPSPRESRKARREREQEQERQRARMARWRARGQRL